MGNHNSFSLSLPCATSQNNPSQNNPPPNNPSPPTEALLFWDRYHYLRNLSNTHTCNVYKVQNIDTKEILAVKVISKSNNSSRNSNQLNAVSILRHEYETLKNLNHKNILQVASLEEDCHNMYLVSEYCGKGDLIQVVRQLGDEGKVFPNIRH